MRPIIHFVDPDRPFAYGRPGDPDDADTAEILRVARALAPAAGCHLFQTLQTGSEAFSDGLHIHGMTHLLRDDFAEPDAVVLVDAYDLLGFVQRMTPNSRLVLWMFGPPGERWPGLRRVRDRFGADVVAPSTDVARALGVAGDADPAVRVLGATADGPNDIDAWLRLLGLESR